MTETTAMEKKELEQQEEEKECPQIYQLHVENSFVRFERYRKSKTVCVQVTSCPHRAIIKTIPKVSSQIFIVNHLLGWSEMAQIASPVPIQHIRIIRFKQEEEVTKPPSTSLSLSSPTIRVRLPKNDEPASVEFNLAVKIF